MTGQLPFEETIAAVATPPGRGGVGIIRISGKHALAIAAAISAKEKLSPRHAYYASFKDSQGELIDQGIILFFQAPHSFTGEDVVELQTHGSPVVLDRLLNLCIEKGARLARPGEFSERAFLNNKIDLTQAEAIADLIDASSTAAARMAMQSLQGAFSEKITELNKQIIYLRTYVEAAIDFPEEEIDFLADGKIAGLLAKIITRIQKVQQNAAQGAMMREGLSVVIAGRPNAGKSTLINQLSGREVAIVTDIAGTTRDVMREFVLLDGLPIHLVDTAGLRDSDDPVEKEGIRRAYEEVHRADCVLMVIDIQDKTQNITLDASIQQQLPKNVPIIRLFNKIDLLKTKAHKDETGIYLSAQSGQGMDLLIEHIKQTVGFHPTEGQFIARRRHLAALQKAENLLLNGQQQLQTAKALELLADDLRLAHLALGEITGEFNSDDLLGEIFSSFCIGK